MSEANKSSIELAVAIARRMNLGEEEIRHLRRGAMLHDIGELGIPDEVMQKTGFLTEKERAIMMRHPQIAHDMLTAVQYLKPAVDIPYCHHERWDGTGYPRGLKGIQIPIAARIFAVVDVWEAMRTEKPHNPAWPDEIALDYIRKESGSLFDPRVVDVFVDLIQKNRHRTVQVKGIAPHHRGDALEEHGKGIIQDS